MSLVGKYTKDDKIKKFMLCRLFNCLPSQLEKEDAKTMEEFIIINNELQAREEDRVQQMEAEAKLKGGM